MFRKENLTGASIEIDYCGCHLQSPFILTSGPLCYGAEGLIRGHRAGCGAVVTKTIRLAAAVNPAHHMGTVGGDSLINCEKWSDYDRLRWYELEIPQAAAAGAVVIGSVGHTLPEAQAIVADVEGRRSQDDRAGFLYGEYPAPHAGLHQESCEHSVICKSAANWPDPWPRPESVWSTERRLCAIDSIGPVLKIDIKTPAGTHERRRLRLADRRCHAAPYRCASMRRLPGTIRNYETCMPPAAA